MVQLVHLACGQADLVAIGGVAGGGLGDNGPLGQLPLHGLLNGRQRVRCACQTHGGVYIGTARKRVPNGAAHTGGRPAEGLDLRGVVVGLILKQEQPVLFPRLGVHLDLDRAGVNLLGLIQLGHFPLLFEVLGHNGADIHEVDGFGPVQSLAGIQILFIGLLKNGAGKLHPVNGGQERGVPAVVRPVGIDDPQFGHGGVPVLGAEIVPAEPQIIQVHGQTILGHHGLQFRLLHLPEAGQRRHRLGDSIVHGQGFKGLQRGLPGLYRVNEIFLNGRHFRCGQLPRQMIHPGRAHQGPLPLGENLDALGSGVSPLVKLSGEILHGKDNSLLGQCIRHQIQLRF